MAQDAKPTQAPLLCANGCGFYGNQRTNGMCSVCYRDSLQRHNGGGRVSEPVPTASASIETPPSPQLSLVTPGPSLEENSQSPGTTMLTMAVTQVEPDSGTSQAERTTDDVAGITYSTSVQDGNSSSMADLVGPGGSVDHVTRRGKRKSDEVLQLDEDIGEGGPGAESDVSVEPSTDELEKLKTKKNRCFTCRKKVGLTGFDCRCGNLFCGVHRYSDVHDCTFDYKADAAQKIRKENPVIVGEKIKKI